jgi:hypothetical protein
VSARAAVAGLAVDRRARGRVSARLAAEAALLVVILAVAVGVRLLGLADPTDVSDEGIRGVQLRLLAAGFRPVSEIYASQGPLSLWLFYPLVAILGPDIVVGRLTVVIASLVCVVATAWIAREQGGPVAGLVAAAIVALSPGFLETSRLAFVEVPSIAPTVLALVCLLLYRRNGRRRWLIASAALLATGTLAKPMADIAGLPALVLILAPGLEGSEVGRAARGTVRTRLRDLGLFGAVGLTVCLVAVAAVGPAALYEQVVVYRIGARAVRGWDLLANAELIVGELRRNGWGVLLAAGAGLAGVALSRRPLGLALAAWLVGGVAVLLFYSPLWPKHVAYVVPPLAILAGAGFASIGALVSHPKPWRRAVPGLAAILALALVAAQATTLAGETRAIVYRHAGSDLSRYAGDLELVEAATRPGDFVVVDDAYLAMLTGRLTPPFLADLSWNRILARALTGEQAIAETRRYDSRVLILEDDHLGQIQRYVAWADREYVLVKSYTQRRPIRFRRVYVNSGVDLMAVRAALRASLGARTDVEIGPAALLGYDLERREWKTGSRVDLTLMFEALQDRPPEHALVTRLLDGSGASVWEGEWKVGDGAQELHSWRAGRFQAQTMRLLIDDVPPGRYSLTIALQRPNGGPARVTARSGAAAWPTGDELDLGEVTVIQ